jgi:hypothetical protein
MTKTSDAEKLMTQCSTEGCSEQVANAELFRTGLCWHHAALAQNETITTLQKEKEKLEADKATHSSKQVEANLRAVVEYGMRAERNGVDIDTAMTNIGKVVNP